MTRYRITITSQDREAMLDLVRSYHLNVFDHGSRYSKATGYSVDAIADTAHIDQLKDAGYQVQTHEDVDKVGAERQREVGRGNRYKKA
jgi:biotin operon repressor